MQKNNQTNPSHSPTVTPQSIHTKSKSMSGHSKPPHCKKPHLDQKSQQPIKRPKHRTNSCTPKPAKLNIFDRGFHNANLSDTDVSSKYVDLTYTNSKLKSSLCNKLDLTSKVKDVKKPKNIDKIIKKSLIKAKNQKISQERVNKETKIEKEIKKNEICLQNKQIRTQNLLRYKRKRKGKKKQMEKEKGRSESVIKIKKEKNCEDGKKKRSVSSVDYYQSVERCSDPEILECIEQKANNRNGEEGFRYLERVAKEISEASRLEKLRKDRKLESKLKRKLEESGKNELGEEIKVERNISFIEEVSEMELFSKPSSRNNLEIGSLLREIRENEVAVEVRDSAACTIQRFFRKYLITRFFYMRNPENWVETSSSISIFPLSKPQLSIISVNDTIKVTPKLKVLTFNHSDALSIRPKIRSLKTSETYSLSIIKTIQIQNPLSVEKQNSVTIKGKMRRPLAEQLQEQIAANLAQINTIEQLRIEELILIENITKDSKDQAGFITAVHNKYKSLLSALKNHSRQSQSEFLDNLSVSAFSDLKKSQQDLEESFKAQLKTTPANFYLNIPQYEFDISGQVSSDLSSDEVESLGGISHSHSMSQLLSDSGTKHTPSQNPEPRFPIFFSIDDQIEVKNLNFVAEELKENSSKDLPSLPTFSLLALNHFSDAPNSEVRILTSADSVIDFAQEMLKKIDFSSILETLTKPIKKDPLIALDKLNNKPIGSVTEYNFVDFPRILDIEKLLKADENESDFDSTVREISKADFIHKKMILLVIDGLLQKFRPYGDKGEPFLWESKQKVLKRKLLDEEVKKRVLRDLEILGSCQIGRIFSEEIISLSGGIDEDIIECLREEKLEKVILYEIFVEDSEWVCYDFEEMQTVLDLADLLMEDLADELIKMCSFID